MVVPVTLTALRASALSVSVSVYELLEEKLKGSQLPWVKRDGKSLADHILFLGRPSSFAMDAVQPGMSGGSVYFIDPRPLYGGPGASRRWGGAGCSGTGTGVQLP